VVAIGRCRLCSDAYCRSHISATAVDDRPFRTRWEPWTCGNCIEDNQREIRALQLARCENVSLQMQRIPKLKNVRTPNGKRPPLVNLFQHPRKATERPPRYAEAFLVEYDGGPPNPRYEGLALSKDGSTVYNVGLPVTGVPKDRIGPKRNLAGYIVKNVIDVELLDEASGRSTKDPWFEFAARSFLRVAHHIGIKPDFSIVFDAPLEPVTDDDDHDDDHDDESVDPGESADPDESVDLSESVDLDLQPDGVVSDSVIGVIADDVQSIEVEHDPTATVQMQPTMATRQPDPPLSPPLPLPHP